MVIYKRMIKGVERARSSIENSKKKKMSKRRFYFPNNIRTLSVTMVLDTGNGWTRPIQLSSVNLTPVFD